MSENEFRVQCPNCLEEFDKPDEFSKIPRHDFKKAGKTLDCPGSFTLGVPVITPLGPPKH
ncbi:hypothetical protein ACFLVZ_00750 [Chloroflexota bacterium]